MMVFEQHIPSGPLSEFIDNIVFFEGYSAEHLVDKLLPDGGIYVLMNMDNKPNKLYHDPALKSHTEFTGSFISGQHKGYLLIQANHSTMMVTKFKLGGAFAFFDIPLSQLNDKVQQLEPLWGNSVEEIRNKIISEKDVSRKFRIIEEFYLSKIRPAYKNDPEFNKVLQFLSENPHLASIKELASQMNISQKHLISLFDKRVGLTPKYLARIFRFQKVIMQLEERKEINWSDIAHECGYYDQSHFSKDFFEFSGINPSQYPNLKGTYMNYIPMQ